MKRAVFRVDASIIIGIGHIMRCLSLAEELRSRGVLVSFICRAHEGNLISTIRGRNFSVVSLPLAENTGTEPGSNYESWLGTKYQVDAEQTISALGGTPPDWLIIDHYGIDIRWEQRLRAHVGKLMVIDDLANRSHDCDVLLDQNYSLDGTARYVGRVSSEAALLTGPRYALLAQNYAAFARAIPLRSGPPRRVLVFFGGSDPQNVTGMTLQALSVGALSKLEVDVVVGANNPNSERIEALAKDRPKTTVHGFKRDLVGLMAEADLAIGGGGSTTWERMCIGLPAVVVSIADNQKPACEALAKANLIYYAGPSESIAPSALADLVKCTVKNVEEVTELRARNRKLVDGLGVGRVAQVMFPSRIEELRLVSAPAEVATGGELDDERDQLVDDLLLDLNGVPFGRLRYEDQNRYVALDWTLDSSIVQKEWEAYFVARAMKMIQATFPVELGVRGRSRFFSKRDRRKQSEHTRRQSLSIVILSDSNSWINEYIPDLLLCLLNDGHLVLWIHDTKNLCPADLCFMLGCGQIVPASQLDQFRNCLVVHESELPEGKGWSPLTWQILEGKQRIPVTLLEAVKKVDSGVIYAERWLTFEGHELIGEMRVAVGSATMELCERFVHEYPESAKRGRTQVGDETFFSRRTPGDSRINIKSNIDSQFELLRVVDNRRYPAFFEIRGHRYILGIMKEGKG